MFYTSLYVILRLVFDFYAILIFIKVAQIYLVAFNIISYQSAMFSMLNFISSYTVDPFVFLLLYLIPELENYYISFILLIFSFLAFYKFIILLTAEGSEATY